MGKNIVYCGNAGAGGKITHNFLYNVLTLINKVLLNCVIISHWLFQWLEQVKP